MHKKHDKNMSSFDWLDAIVFINLDRRPDRLEHIQGELKKIDDFPVEKIHKQTAFDEHLAGCLKSHQAALELARDKGWTNILIFEDDFTWRGDPNQAMAKMKHFWEKHHHEFGFVQLTHLGLANVRDPKQIEDNLYSTTWATNAAGYLVHSRAYDSLIRIFAAAYQPMKETQAHWLYSNDVLWNKVRGEFPTYLFVPALGYQYGNFSDLGRGETPDRG